MWTKQSLWLFSNLQLVYKSRLLGLLHLNFIKNLAHVYLAIETEIFLKTFSCRSRHSFTLEDQMTCLLLKVHSYFRGHLTIINVCACLVFCWIKVIETKTRLTSSWGNNKTTLPPTLFALVVGKVNNVICIIYSEGWLDWHDKSNLDLWSLSFSKVSVFSISLASICYDTRDELLRATVLICIALFLLVSVLFLIIRMFSVIMS